jgi:release factor glutamine methyltransferase
VTVLEAIQRSTEFLSRKGVESPRLQAELLLAHVLRLPRMRLYLSFDRTLIPPEQDLYRDLVCRRGRREPLQHIVGSTCFCGLELAVNRNVLIPRPETELLAEAGWEILNRRAVPASGTLRVLDWGTGSGCLAIAVAVHCPQAEITAVDASSAALEVAAGNVARHGLPNRVRLKLSDGFSGLEPEEKFDLILSNPPYIPTAEIATLEPEVREFDPRCALDGGADGLDYYRRFAREAGGHLRPGGQVLLEFGDGQAQAVRQLFEEQKWIVEAVREDYTHRARILIASQTKANG